MVWPYWLLKGKLIFPYQLVKNPFPEAAKYSFHCSSFPAPVLGPLTSPQSRKQGGNTWYNRKLPRPCFSSMAGTILLQSESLHNLSITPGMVHLYSWEMAQEGGERGEGSKRELRQCLCSPGTCTELRGCRNLDMPGE